MQLVRRIAGQPQHRPHVAAQQNPVKWRSDAIQTGALTQHGALTQSNTTSGSHLLTSRHESNFQGHCSWFGG